MNVKSKEIIFRKKNILKRRSRIKLFIESILFLTIGSSLTLFLNSIPNRIIFKDFTEEIWIGLSQGLVLIFESSVLIAKASSVLILIVVSFILIIGGILRFIKLLSLTNNSSTKRKPRNIYRK